MLARASSQCDVCRQWGRGRVCTDCITRFAAPVPRCPRCALRLSAPAPSCGRCLHEPPVHEHAVCVADYGFPWDRLIADFKFHGQAELAIAFAELLAGAVRAAAPPAPDLVLPVPLAPRRLAERGYNQAWELARRVAHRLALPARCELLLRPRETAPQADLPRVARLANLRSAFAVAAPAPAALAGRRVALVDDVLTTGATARAAARVLLDAGAAAVDVWVLARTAEN